MAKYFLTNKAVEHLARIWNHSFETWLERQADKYYRILIAACGEIAGSPDIGKKYAEIAKDIFGFRVGKHVIFYRETKLRKIEVLRILHETVDLKNRIDQ
jgi:toxin ParE1/3/4